jgi:hypothetical protein
VKHLRFNEEAMAGLKPSIRAAIHTMLEAFGHTYNRAVFVNEIEDDDGIFHTTLLSAAGAILIAASEAADECVAGGRGLVTPERVIEMVRKYLDEREQDGGPVPNVIRLPKTNIN